MQREAAKKSNFFNGCVIKTGGGKGPAIKEKNTLLTLKNLKLGGGVRPGKVLMARHASIKKLTFFVDSLITAKEEHYQNIL